MDGRKGISAPITALFAFAVAILLSVLTYLVYVSQASVGEGLAGGIAEEQGALAERIGYVYWDPLTGRLWVSNDGSVPARVRAIYVDGVEVWSGDVELKPGEIKAFQISYGETVTILTERGIHVIRG